MTLIIWLIFVLLIAAAVLGVAKAVLALRIFDSVREFTGVVYALIVLLVVLYIAASFYGGAPAFDPLFPRVRP